MLLIENIWTGKRELGKGLCNCEDCNEFVRGKAYGILILVYDMTDHRLDFME